jgi:uncharacterized membrane protein
MIESQTKTSNAVTPPSTAARAVTAGLAAAVGVLEDVMKQSVREKAIAQETADALMTKFGDAIVEVIDGKQSLSRLRRDRADVRGNTMVTIRSAS